MTPSAAPSTAPLIEIGDLEVRLPSADGPVHVVRGVDLAVDRGEVLGVVGESGAGKTVSMRALVGLLPEGAQVRGSVRWQGREVLGLRGAALRQLRGAGIGMIFQDPAAALNPVITIGRQLVEAIRAHDPSAGPGRATERAVELLARTGLPDPLRRMRDHPHHLSGGMCQRAMIAMALANEPDLLIADEPTTALDVTVQAQILDLLREIRDERQLAVIMITHDLAVLAGLADRVAVLYAGRIVEQGPVRHVFRRPLHPYTRGLLAAVPRLDRRRRLLPMPGTAAPTPGIPVGCAFRPRCSRATSICATVEPRPRPVGGTEVACHHPAVEGGGG